ncbi:GGDEF domain-containing protein [Salinisphaera sp. T31B1]|uniref:GGDEF domain-containing protein n=1 Tax=Salinisphaera sp. T31B1 TaxID=727963 RepID=UPI0033407F9F
MARGIRGKRGGRGQQAASRYADSTTDIGREQRFWLAMLYAALAGYLSVLAVVHIYIRLTSALPNRGWINAILLATLAFTAGFYLCRHQIVTMRYRLVYLVLADILAAAIILAISALDGGIGSPVAGLLILPIVYLAIGYPRPAVLVCGMAILAGAAAVFVTSNPGADVFTAIFRFIALAIALLLAGIGATARDWEKGEIRRLRLRLEQLASTDELTGCVNQRAFGERLADEVERAHSAGHPLSLMVIDIDRFKQINDRHGHDVGDRVLRQLGGQLRLLAGDQAIPGRPGGDELAILAPGADCRAALRLAERLRCAFASRADPIRTTVSVGVAELGAAPDTAAMLFRRADQALYRAKAEGRDRVATAPVSDPRLEAGRHSTNTLASRER